ncbi:LAETG motif-containing sortase-dependent surface protein [Streptomyces fructofermentans]|uniref:LAETG motif-containing sortase-dependent surface protein n=1 Tax=Streptomyces fructofermentans TaxID=152141 RepID=UPI0037AD2E2B
MNLFSKPAAVAVTALALAALPAAAVAHDGSHPFANCTEAYDNGYANIRLGDAHYAERLDRDKDGIGCDKPPADFVPAQSGADGDGEGAEDSGAEDTAAGTSDGQDTDLAETGGSDVTPYLAAGSAVALLAGGAVLITARRREHRDTP